MRKAAALLVLLAALAATAHAQFFVPPYVAPTAATSGPVAISTTASGTDTAAGSTFTETAVNFGTASSGRCLAVGFETRSNTVGLTISGVTIGGITATLVKTASQGGGGTDLASLWVAAVPTGTSGNVVVTFSGSMLRMGYSLWAITGASSCTPTASGSNTTAGATTLSTTLNVSANGGVVAVNGTGGIAGGSATTTWTGVTKDADSAIGGTVQGYSTGHATYVGAQTPLTVTSAVSASSNIQLVAGSWGP